MNRRDRLEQERLFKPTPRFYKYLILRELQKSPKTTQEKLAHHTGLSIGMINFYLKALEAAGLISYSRQNSKMMSYLPTAAGVEFIQLVEPELPKEYLRMQLRYNLPSLMTIPAADAKLFPTSILPPSS